MHKKLVDISLQYRFFVLLGVIGITFWGIYEYTQLPVDAFPDISPVMVPVFTDVEGMAPEEVERLVTFPIESVMNGLPGVRQIKSTSAFGMSVVYIYFDDDVDMYFARNAVDARLSEAISRLPVNLEKPKMGPISTGLGQIFIYYLTIEDHVDTGGIDPLTYLRDINDWVVKYQLQTVTGVTDILSVGGHVLQYQVNLNPNALQQYQLSLDDVVEAIEQNNANVGGQYIVSDQEENLVRGIGLLKDLADIEAITIKVENGVAIRVVDVADVQFGKEIRRGVVSRNGSEEVVSGLVMQLYGQNTSEVIERLYEKIPYVQKSLPDGVKLVPYYEQQELVSKATSTVKSALLKGAVFAAVVLFLFLGNLRTALVVVFALPFSALVSVILMRSAGMSANLMSLGGIAIAVGMLVDGAIVMVENIYRHLNTRLPDDEFNRTDIIMSAAIEVAKPIIFAILIVVVVFVPILTLHGVEGKMFIPMSLTLCFALLGSLVFATVVAPPLSSYLLHTGKHKEFFLFVWLQKLHDPLLNWSVKNPRKILLIVLAMVAVSVAAVPYLGTEFIPTLEEGSILIGATMSPSISLEKAVHTVQKIEKDIVSFGEVHEVVSRIGRPEAGSHPHPVNYAEVHIELNDAKSWEGFSTKAEFVEILEEKLKKHPGVQLNFSQPIQNAFDELLSGVRAQIAIKLFGDDLDVLQAKATEIRNTIDNIEGLVDVAIEQSFGQPQVQVIADRQQCSRYGINASEILELVETAIGGKVVDYIYLNTRQYGIQVRYQEKFRDRIETLESLLIQAPDGVMVPLGQVAEVKQSVGPIQINREGNQRRWIVQGNVRNRDLGSVISDIRNRIDEKIDLPDGYHIDYGGQFENQVRAMKRLAVIVPLVIFIIFMMLYLAFGAMKSAFLVMINIPLALIGGVFGLLIMQQYLSVPAAVGFIALFGIAIQDSMVLVTCINQIYREGVDIEYAIITGCHKRLRPVIITSVTTVLGLLPLLVSTGIGAEVQRPLAAVVIFGLTSSTLLTLFVIPAFYRWFAVQRK